MLQLDNPYTMIVTGQTGSGKTHFIERLIRNEEQMHKEPFSQIVFAYGIFDPDYLALAQQIPKLKLTDGFPDEIMEAETTGQTLLILEDLMLEMQDSRIASLFTRMRHRKISTIFVLQNLYFRSKYMTTVSRNAHYLCVFPNPRDLTIISTLGRQMFPLKPRFLPEAFSLATSAPYGYLFIDSKPGTDQRFRVRDNIFPGENTRIYLPK